MNTSTFHVVSRGSTGQLERPVLLSLAGRADLKGGEEVEPHYFGANTPLIAAVPRHQTVSELRVSWLQCPASAFRYWPPLAGPAGHRAALRRAATSNIC